MIKHVVMWNFKPEVNVAELVQKLDGLFAAFKNEVPGMTALEIRQGFEGFDACLISEHEDKASLEAYQVHPKHLEIKEIVGAARTERAACDFVF